MSVVIEQFLREVMAQYNAGAGTITLGATINQAVADLLAYAQTSSIALSGATVTSTSTQVVIQGAGPIAKLGGAQSITLTGTDAGGTLGLVLTAVPGTALDLKSIFPGLKGTQTAQNDGMIITAQSLFYSLRYLNPQWLLTNIAPPEGVIYPALGLNLKADVPLGSMFPRVVALTNTDQVCFRGPVSFPVDDDTQLYLDAEFPGFSMVVGTMAMSQFHLVIRTVYYEDEPDQDNTGNLFTGVLDLGNGVSARIGVDTQVVPPNNPDCSIWSFYADFDKPLTLVDGINALSAFLGGGSFDLPPALPLIGSVGLSQLVVGVNPYDFTDIEFVFIEVATTEKWAPIPWVSVDEVHCQWQILQPFKAESSQSGGVGGTLAIGKTKPVHLGLTALIPDYVINANLSEGDTISVVEVISNFFPDAGGLSQDLVIDQLDVVADIDNNTYELSGSVKPVPPLTLDLIITELTLNRVSANVNYTPDQLYATILANLELFEADWQVAASYLKPTGDESGNWSFLIQMEAGSTVNLSMLLGRFLNFNPASIPQVTLDVLYFYYDLGSKTYRFKGVVKGYWALPLIPGSPALNAKAAVAVENFHPEAKSDETAYKGSIDGTLDINRFMVGVGYAFDPTNTTLSFMVSYKQIALYGTWMQSKKKDGTTQSLIKINFGDLSLGEIITYLVNLANPNLDFSLDTPWDILNSLNLKNLSLVVDLNDYTVGIEYYLGVNLVFVDIETVSLTLKKKDDGKQTVVIGLTGSFLDQSFGGEDDELTWDLLDDPPPAVPGRGTKVFDLHFCAIGQHVEVQGYQSFETVEDAINALKGAMKPLDGSNVNPLTQLGGALVFNKDSHILFGAQFVVLEGIAFSAVLNDPNLYGLLIQLSGEVSKSLSGLKFELLYKRITDTLGVFKVVFQVPEAFRQLEFGEVSVTLPIIKVDVYTNGNFKVDLGFPTDESFSDSFAIQVFPFIGKGGFYFGYLVGAASKTVPVVTNGAFAPVIELGLALAVGVGKEINKGPLSAGLSLTLQAILEGTLAWFHPYDTSLPVDSYFRVIGTVAIVGKLYGAVDFKVIKVSLAVVARASVTLVIECYMPIRVQLVVEVSVEASVKILFIRIHFSFDLSLDLSFEIGSAQPTPWIVDASAGRSAPSLSRRSAASNRGLPRPIRETQRVRRFTPLNRVAAVARPGAPRRMTAIRPRLRAEGDNFLALRAEMPPHLYVAATPRATFDWDAVRVFDAQKVLPVLVLPSLSVAESTSLLPEDRGPDATTTVLPLTLVVENGIHADAASLAELRTVTAETAHTTSDPTQLPFNLLADGMLAWSIASFLVEGQAALDGDITRTEMELLVDALNKAQTDGDAFTSEQLKGFFDLNYLFRLGCYTGDPAAVNQSGATFIPIPPVLSLAVPGKPKIDFARYRIVGDSYEDAVAAYFAAMTIDYGSDNAAHPRDLDAITPAGADESVAAMIQRDYYLMVARAVAQKGLDLMVAMPVPVGAATSLASLLTAYPRGVAGHRIHQGETVSSLEATYYTTLEELQRLNPDVDFTQPLTAGEIISVPEGPTAESIVAANATRTDLFVDQAAVPIRGAVVQAGSNDSLSGLARRFNVGLGDLVTLNLTSPRLLATGAAFALPSFTISSVTGDSLNFVAAFLLVRNGEVPADPAQAWYTLPNFNWYKQTIANLNATTVDFAKPLPVGTSIAYPVGFNTPTAAATPYLSRRGDTLERIAGYVLLFQTPTDGMVAFRESLTVSAVPRPAPTDPLVVGTAITVPAWSHVIQTEDSLAQIMALLGISQPVLLTSASLSDPASLTQLAAVTLPDLSYAVSADQSFNSLAELFNLSLDSLAASVLNTTGYLVSGFLTVPNLYQLAVETLRAQVGTVVNEIASSSSHAMMHGLRLPPVPANPGDPVDTSTLYGLFEIVGQQVTVDSLTLPATLTLSSDDANVLFNQTYVVTASDSWDSLVAQYPGFAGYNPGLTASDIKPGLLVFITQESQLDITIDPAFVAAHRASATLDMQWADPAHPLAALPLSESNPAQYSLPDLAGWQTPTPPPYGGHPVGTLAGAGTPGLWAFSNTLLNRIAAGQTGSSDYRLMQGVLNDRGKMVSTELAYYSWASLIDLTVQLVPQEPPGLATESAPASSPTHPASSGSMPNTYLVLAGSDESQRLLQDLWSFLRGATGAKPVLRLLYPASVQSDNPEGWVSLTEDSALTYVVKTNLSTLSTSGQGESATIKQLRMMARADADTGPVYVAPLSSAADFLQLLWEGGVVASGGYFLNYQADGQGLPASIFDDRGIAQLRLLIILGSQSDAVAPDRQLYPFNNVAVVGDSITASGNVYIERTDGSDRVISAAVPPGVVGFKGSRTQPPAEPPVTGADSWRTQMLYSMLGYRTDAQGGFKQSNQALPVGPAVPPDQAQSFRESRGNGLSPWYYQQNIPAAELAPVRLPVASFLPDPAQDPYRGIAAGAAITVSFSANDVYGNQMVPQTAIADLGLAVGYTDDLIPLSSWPGTSASYDVIAGGAVGFSLFLGFQAGSVVPGNGTSPDQALTNVSTQSLKYRQVYYQIMQAGLQPSLLTSLMKNPAVQDGSYPIDGARLRHYVQAVYTFLGAAARIAPFAVTVPSSPAVTTFARLAQDYPLTVAQIGKANAAVPLASLFATVTIPDTASFPQNGTLGAMATAAATSPGTLASLNSDILLSASVGVVTPKRTITTAASAATLTAIASAATTTINALALANAAKGGILTTSIPVEVDGTSLQVLAGESFNDLVVRFAALGVTTNPQTIATANADSVGLIVPGSVLDTTIWVARAVETFSTLAALDPGWTPAAIGEASASVVNLVRPGLALDLGTVRTVTPGPTDSFESYTTVYARTLDQLVRSNAANPLRAGARVLMDGMAVPDSLAAVPFSLPLNATWNGIAASLGLAADLDGQAALMEDNRNVPDLLLAGQTVTLGGASTVTTADSTFASVLAALNGSSGTFTYSDLIRSIATVTGLLRPDGTLATLPPPLPAGRTLGQAAADYGVTAEAFAVANAATVDVIAANVTLTVKGQDITTRAGDTFATLTSRLVALTQSMVTVSDVAQAAAAIPGFLTSGSRVLLPPSAARMDVVFYTAPPQNPPYSGTAFELTATLSLRRPTDCIHPDFGTDAAVAAFAVPIPPVQEGDGSSGLLLTPFATRFEAMFPDIKIAVGARQGDTGDSGTAHVYCVNFSTTGVSQVALTTGQPAVFAIKPITNQTLNLSNIAIRPLGPDGLLGEATYKDFNGIDPDLWAGQALALIDLLLTPEMAVPTLALAPDEFTQVMAAKQSLAQTIANGLVPVLDGTESSGIDTARERLRQALLVNLASGFAVDAALQYRATVTANGDTVANLSGKPVPRQPHNLLVEALPGYDVTTGKTALSTGTSRVDFLLTVPQERRHKQLLMDLLYQINEFEYDIKDVPQGQGFKSSRWLSFVRPITADDHPPALTGIELGVADIPLALRAYPDLPVMRSQSCMPGACSPLAVFPDSLLQARTWSYSFEFNQLSAAQDDTTVTVLYNQDPSTDPERAAGTKLRDLCQTLAQFQAVCPELKTMLLGLLDPATVAGNTAVLTNALGTFAGLVDEIQSKWRTYWQPTGAEVLLASGLVPSRFDASVEPQVAEEGDKVFLRALVLTAPTGTGYDAAQYPAISYRSANADAFTDLVKSVTTGTGVTSVTYTFTDPLVEAYQAMTYRYRFDGLNAIAQQDAWAELVVKRNLNLVSWAETAAEFIYSTPPVTFGTPSYPALVRDQVIDVRTSTTETLAEAVAAIFATLFQGGSGSYTIRVLARYGYTLAAPVSAPASEGLSDADIISVIPVVFYPNFTYSDGFQAQLVNDLNTWFNHHQPATDRGSYAFDVTVFSSLDKDLQQPVLEIANLIFRMIG